VVSPCRGFFPTRAGGARASAPIEANSTTRSSAPRSPTPRHGDRPDRRPTGNSIDHRAAMIRRSPSTRICSMPRRRGLATDCKISRCGFASNSAAHRASVMPSTETPSQSDARRRRANRQNSSVIPLVRMLCKLSKNRATRYNPLTELLVTVSSIRSFFIHDPIFWPLPNPFFLRSP